MMTGTKSFNASYGGLRDRWGLMTCELEDVISNVYPSGAALATISEPIMPPAPDRLSTTTCWPHAAESFCAMVRANKSVPPPGGKGAMTRIGRTG